jgi:hypothetical protein
MFKFEQLLQHKAILIRKEIKKLIKRTFNQFVSRPDSKYMPVFLTLKNIRFRSFSESK